MLPIIGITANHNEKRYQVADAYAESVKEAGGLPIILPSEVELIPEFISFCDGFVFTGGDDPRMEEWDVQTHPNATPVSTERQKFELTLLRALQNHSEKPVLGICLGMQWMCLLAGGLLEQDLQANYAMNHKNSNHQISGEIGQGLIHSHHHQAITDAGTLKVIAIADDGLIEAVQDTSRRWYIGVQWHPERTGDVQLGRGMFKQLIQKCAECQVALK